MNEQINKQTEILQSKGVKNEHLKLAKFKSLNLVFSKNI